MLRAKRVRVRPLPSSCGQAPPARASAVPELDVSPWLCLTFHPVRTAQPGRAMPVSTATDSSGYEQVVQLRRALALFKTVAITRSARASAFASASFRVAHRRAHQASRRHQPPSVHPLLARVPLASARRAPSERTISPASTGIARLPGTCCGPVRDVEPNAGSRIITPRGRPGRRMDFRRARLGVGSCSRRPMCEPRSRWKPG